MKTVFLSIALFLFMGSGFAQTSLQGKDPLARDYTLLSSAEMMLLFRGWGDDINQRLYDYDNQTITKGEYYHTDSTLYGNQGVDVVAGNWDGDSDDDLLFAWEGQNNDLILSLPHIDPSTLNWTSTVEYIIPNALLSANYRDFRLVALNIDDDFEQEFLVAYVNANEEVVIKLFETDSNLNPIEITSRADIVLPASLGGEAMFDISAGDLNGDFEEEIILVASEANAGGTGNWGIMTQVYEFDNDNQSLSMKASATLYKHADNTQYPAYGLNRVLVATGDLDGREAEEGILQFQVGRVYPHTATYLQAFCISPDLETIIVNPNTLRFLWHQSNGVNGAMNVVTGDLDNDGKDEIAAGDKRTLGVLKSDDNFNLTTVAETWLSPQSDIRESRTVAIRDLDADPSDPVNIAKPELIIAINFQGDQEWMHLRVLQLNSSNNTLELQAEMEDEFYDLPNAPGVTEVALITGDFDGDALRVGRPKHFSRTEILQPMVILNAPPVHFDVFGDTTYDISYSFNNNQSQFVSTYETENGVGMEVSTEVSADWGVSQELSASGGAYGLSASASIEKRFGGGFSRFSAASKNITVTVRVEAKDDDYIYATVADYDIWEYPLYGDGLEQTGHIAFVIPKVTENRWFPSRSWSGHAYTPNHENGNILSYLDYVNLDDNEAVAERIKGASNESFTLDGNSNIDWSVLIQDFSQSGASTSRSNSLNMSASGGVGFGPFSVNVGVSSSYSEGSLSTHQTSVSNQIGFNVHLDAIDLSVGETIYNVAPYAYWDRNSALVIDYAVRPEEAQPGFTPTWWQVKYGDKPDPALILPWRYDPEKGRQLQFPEKRYQTKEIAFVPNNPSPGDTVRIETRVHNYSLIPTAGEVKVRFYIGNPDNGGIPITSIYGDTEATTGTPVNRRGQAVASMVWAVPQGLDPLQRIYAVIDPDNLIDEIHDNNNKGWTVFGNIDTPTGIDGTEATAIPKTLQLEQNYPNPFNPTTTIVFTLQQPEKVTLTVYDILGQKVKTLLDAEKPAGKHQVHFNAAGLGSGVYFYRLQTEQFAETRKMILMR